MPVVALKSLITPDSMNLLIYDMHPLAMIITILVILPTGTNHNAYPAITAAASIHDLQGSASASDVLILPDEPSAAAEGGNYDLVIANATNTSSPILRSGDGSYAWQFLLHRNKLNNATQRLLVVLSTLYNTTIVWVANRDHPVSPDAALVLRFPSRSLLLLDTNGSVAWVPQADNVRSVHMNGTGNLLLLGAHNSTLWQSFDYPTDILLPGQRLRTNHSVTGSIDYWNGEFSPGRYTLKAEPGGAVLYASFDAQQHMVPYELINYAGGLDNNITTALHSACNHTAVLYREDAEGVSLEQDGVITPECRAETKGIADNAHGISFTTHLGGDGFRYLRIMPTGDIHTYLLSSSGLSLDNEFFEGFFRTYCKLPSYCGVNSLCSSVQTCTCPDLFQYIDSSDPTRGCRLVTPLNCSIFRQHEFLELTGVDYFANSFISPLGQANSAKECKSLCLANCSCTAAFYNNDTMACHAYDQVQTMQPGLSPSVTAFLRVAQLPRTPSLSTSKPFPRSAIIGISSGLGVTVICLALLAGWIARRVMRKSSDESDSEEEAFLEGLPGLPPRFAYKDVYSATQGFSKRLGTGGSGAVYEGEMQLPSNSNQLLVKVAVKQLKITERSTIAASSKKQFRAEVATLGSLSHVNLVQLKGFCAEGIHRLLIYEYLENGSLDKWIFRSASPEATSDDSASHGYILPWQVRYRIALDTARGLAFLHEECRDKVVHLDVKPQNILLDGSFRAKLSDFGMSKLMDRTEQSQTVTAMRGTPGYMAPEWFLNIPVTDKSDVFSYGMVLLELVGGRKNLNLSVATEEWYFPAWAVKQAESGRLYDVIDKQLFTTTQTSCSIDSNVEFAATADHELPNMLSSMKRLLHVAFWCIQEDAASRPSMATVLLMLEEHVQVPDPPLERTYVLRGQSRPAPDSNASTSGGSVNALSSVLMSPR